MSVLRRSSRLAAIRASAPAPTNLRRSRRLAGLSPASPAPPAWVADNRTTEIVCIARELEQMYPTGLVAPAVQNTRDFDDLLNLAGIVIHGIFSTGAAGRFRPLTTEEMHAWVKDSYNVTVLAGVIRSWVHRHWFVTRRWDEEDMTIALQCHRHLWHLITKAME